MLKLLLGSFVHILTQNNSKHRNGDTWNRYGEDANKKDYVITYETE